MSSRLLTVPPALLAACLSVTCAAGEQLVDPTRPFTTPTSANTSAPVSRLGQVKVEAIFDHDGHRVAIVRGQIVHSGEHCAWGDIEAITLTGIRYTRDGKVQFLELDNPKLQVRRTSRESAP